MAVNAGDAIVPSNSSGETQAYPPWPALETLFPQSQRVADHRALETGCDQPQTFRRDPRDDEFRYGRIESNQIRLLKLEPSCDLNATLRGTLVVSNFLDAGPEKWHALSYVWGSDPAMRLGLILLNGGKRFTITKNLERALRGLRNEQTITYWIDALCINQDDPIEKSDQIRYMRYIYERAIVVTVWLNDANPDTDALMDILSKDHSDAELLTKFAQNEWTNEYVNGIICVAHHPYWRRIWVLQELECGTAITVHCGQYAVPLEKLHQLRDLLLAAFNRRTRPLGTDATLTVAMNATRGLFWSRYARRARAEVVEKRAARDSDTAMALWRALKTARRCEAADMRDKIYAVLGIVEDRQWTSPFFPIDYTLPSQQLYRDVAMWIIVCSRTLQLLTGWRPTQPVTNDLPSWCPDWAAQTPLLNDLAQISEPEPDTYTRWRDAIVSFGPHVDSMTVTGACIGTCYTTTGQIDLERLPWYQLLSFSDIDLYLTGTYSRTQKAHILTWMEMLALSDPDLAAIGGKPHTMADLHVQRNILRTVQEFVPGLCREVSLQARLEQLWRTLVLDCRSPESSMVEDDDKIPKKFRAMFNLITGWEDQSLPAGVDTEEGSEEFVHPFRQREATCNQGRQLAFTDNGLIASVPLDVRKGDLFCCLLGCDVPIILRSQEAHFTVVGEAFIYGYMSLEAVDEMEAGKLQQRTFELR
jgi:hypothetical protein